MTAKAAIVLLIIAALALVLAVSTLLIHAAAKPDPRYWVQASIERDRGAVFFWSMVTAIAGGVTAWVIWP